MPAALLALSGQRGGRPQVGVHDHLDQPVLDCSLPLRATLMYDNGLPVKQTSSSEPLLVGETDVVSLQGAATFKLRITSLSSHRDKQRFRIQVRAPRFTFVAARAMSVSAAAPTPARPRVLPRALRVVERRMARATRTRHEAPPARCSCSCSCGARSGCIA